MRDLIVGDIVELLYDEDYEVRGEIIKITDNLRAAGIFNRAIGLVEAYVLQGENVKIISVNQNLKFREFLGLAREGVDFRIKGEEFFIRFEKGKLRCWLYYDNGDKSKLFPLEGSGSTIDDFLEAEFSEVLDD